VVSRGDTDQGNDKAKLLLQTCSLRMQRLRQPLADGAKAKQSKTKRFHVVPFARMVSYYQTSGGACLLVSP